MTTHATPRPWKVGYRDESCNDLVITDDNDEGNIAKMHPVCRVVPQPFYKDTQGPNAALIVRSVNIHEALIDALRSIAGHSKEFGSIEDPETMLCRIEEKAKRALALAEGKEPQL